MRYLGNKTRMIENIKSFIAENQITGEVFCDLFAGSASVCDAMKGTYKTVIANDVLETSCVFAKAKIQNNAVPTFTRFRESFGQDPFTYFSNQEYEYSEDHFIWMNYSPKGDRQFFTEEVANKIDGVRLELEQLKTEVLDDNEYNFLLASLLESIMGMSNTTGTYEAFLKKWDKRAFKTFALEPLEMNVCETVGDNIVFNEDSNLLIQRIKGDILYLDTPYTITDYNSAYHLLETIVKYDNPEIRGITGRRVKKKEKSKYSVKSKVAQAYEDLIRDAQFQHIIISYSTQSLLPIEELIDMLRKYAVEEQVTVKYYPFREYKNIRSSKKGANLREVLIYIKKKES